MTQLCSLFADVITALSSLNIPIETDVYLDPAPALYIALTSITDSLELYADDTPHIEEQNVRLSLFSKGNYLATKRSVIRALLAAGMTITEMHGNGYDEETRYYQYVIDVSKQYELEE